MSLPTGAQIAVFALNRCSCILLMTQWSFFDVFCFTPGSANRLTSFMLESGVHEAARVGFFPAL